MLAQKLHLHDKNILAWLVVLSAGRIPSQDEITKPITNELEKA